MNDDVKRWHSAALSAFNSYLYDKLIYEHHISSESLKEVILLPLNSTDKEDGTIHRGFFAVKDKIKYLIGPKNYTQLPLKVVAYDKWKYRDDVVFVPTQAKGFNIIPKHSMEFRELVDGFAPFQHTHPDTFIVMKVAAIMADIGRTYMCMVTEPNGGKSSIFKLLHSINNRTPVYQPRSIPGCMNRITGNGNVVWDDIINVPADPRKAMEDMSMQIADGSSVYHNGAMKSHQTKSKYDTPLQSLTFLYNNVQNYQNPEKKYFDNLFENNGAMDDRYLKLFFDGKMTQSFHRDFDITGTAEANQQYYIDMAKELLYLQQEKQSGGYKKSWEHKSVLGLKSRKKLTYDEICWGLDMYSQSQEEYDKFVGILDSAIISYREMLNNAGLTDEYKNQIEEEIVE